MFACRRDSTHSSWCVCPFAHIAAVSKPTTMLSRDSFRVGRRGSSSTADDPLSPPSSGRSAVALLSVRVYDRPDLDVPSYHRRGPPSSGAGRFATRTCSPASASSATGPRRNAAHAHRRACDRRGAMRRAYSMPPPKVRIPVFRRPVRGTEDARCYDTLGRSIRNGS